MAIDVSPDLLAFLQQEETRARNEDLLSKAEAALDSYNGAPYGDEEDGRSQVVTRDVAETVDPMTISLLRTVVSGDRVVEFEPRSPEQEQFADDATEEMARDFSRGGYRLLHDWIKEGLLVGLAVVKAGVDVRKERIESTVPAMLMPEDAIEAEPAGMDPEVGELMRVVTLQDRAPEFKDYLVPIEEFRVSPDARDLDEAAYVGHAVRKTLSDLIEMGFDKETVDGLPSEDGTYGFESLSQSRDDHRMDMGTDRPGAMRRVWLLEEYVRFDADGDGIAERLCVHRVGNEILNIERCDYQPFVAWCPYPMPGRLIGQSLADKVVDIQRVNTVLERLALDGLYNNLAPGTLLGEGATGDNTIDDLLNVRPNRIVRVRDVNQVVPETRPDISSIAFTAMEFKIGQRESRTGITRLNQGLDADSLNKTATGTALMQAQGQQMEEYLARNFAEALARLCRLKLKLKTRFGQETSRKVDGEYRAINPTQWDEDMDVIIRVGLGSGRKEQRLLYRAQLMDIQERCIAGGLSIVDEEHVFKSISGWVKDAGLGSPADFVSDPDSDEFKQKKAQQPEQPDPEQQKVQAELQMKQAEMQQNAQLKAMDLQGKQQEASLKLELMRAEAQERAQLERDKAEFEREQAIAQMQFEMQLRERGFQQNAQLARYKADQDADLKKYRQGGDLSK